MRKYSAVAIIYNPKSTGDSQAKAEQLHSFLSAKLARTPVTLLPTEYAGHAKKLAYDTAHAHKKPLIVSVSGDGGYHEVVNGAMRAQAEGCRPICAVLPAGNANDHARTMHSKPLPRLILKKKIKKLDLLKVTTRHGTQESHSYAHSYIGLGLTPHMAQELNKRELNMMQEVLAFLQTFAAVEPVTLNIGGKLYAYDSFVCSTIPEMAKILKLAKRSKPNDGRFEINAIVHKTKPALFRKLLLGTFVSKPTHKKQKHLEFSVVGKTLMQLDGELQTLAADTHVEVSVERRTLRTLA